MKERNCTTPLCFMPDGRFVCYQRREIVIMKEGRELFRYSLTLTGMERFFEKFKLTSRLLRLGLRASIALDNETIIFSKGNMLYELNIMKSIQSTGYYCGEGIRPLIFTSVEDIEGFDDGVYFGGYLGNMEKKPVSIYKRTGVDEWEVVYTFPQGAVNHVHNIVADPYRKCLWIFTGDFGEAAAIWKVTDNFKEVESVICNDQKYRACVVYALPEGLLYATDAPFANNYIYLMDAETYEVKELFQIDGSCIYGCKWKDKYVFSTTVEGDGRNMSRLEWLFTRKRGEGIKDNYVHMYEGNLQDGFKEIYKEEKDWLPFYTFQFGVFKFPYGENNSDTLYFQPVATKKNDLKLLFIK